MEVGDESLLLLKTLVEISDFLLKDGEFGFLSGELSLALVDFSFVFGDCCFEVAGVSFGLRQPGTRQKRKDQSSDERGREGRRRRRKHSQLSKSLELFLEFLDGCSVLSVDDLDVLAVDSKREKDIRKLFQGFFRGREDSSHQSVDARVWKKREARRQSPVSSPPSLDSLRSKLLTLLHRLLLEISNSIRLLGEIASLVGEIFLENGERLFRLGRSGFGFVFGDLKG